MTHGTTVRCYHNRIFCPISWLVSLTRDGLCCPAGGTRQGRLKERSVRGLQVAYVAVWDPLRRWVLYYGREYLKYSKWEVLSFFRYFYYLHLRIAGFYPHPITPLPTSPTKIDFRVLFSGSPLWTTRFHHSYLSLIFPHSKSRESPYLLYGDLTTPTSLSKQDRRIYTYKRTHTNTYTNVTSQWITVPIYDSLNSNPIK